MDLLTIEIIASIILVVFLSIFLIIKRKNIVIQKIIGPILYLALYRSNFGLKFMDRFAAKYREAVKFFGYCCIGLGFTGMLFIVFNILIMFYMLVFHPVASPGVALVLPFTNIPGIGYLPFFHWIIAIFILAIIHEFAHGIVATAHGLKVKASGFAFLGAIVPIIPAAFVEPDEKKIKEKSDVIQYSIFAAGPMINIILAIILLIAVPYVGYGTVHMGQSLAPFEGKITEPVGFSFKAINESYPAIEAGMEEGIIQEVNGGEVKDYKTFNDLIYGIKPNEDINIVTDKGEYDLVTTESPDDKKRGFIGIRPIANERRVKEDYSWMKGTFYWIKDLFKWLFLFNFLIGLFNLLPLGIVDGGRMSSILLQRVIKDKRRAKKIWSFVSIFILLVIIFALIFNYFGNPFIFLQ